MLGEKMKDVGRTYRGRNLMNHMIPDRQMDHPDLWQFGQQQTFLFLVRDRSCGRIKPQHGSLYISPLNGAGWLRQQVYILRPESDEHSRPLSEFLVAQCVQ